MTDLFNELQILGGITDGLIPLDQESTAGILKDTLVILSSKVIINIPILVMLMNEMAVIPEIMQVTFVSLASGINSSQNNVFYILVLQGIKLASMKKKVVEDLADEGDLAGAELAKAKNKFLTQVSLKTCNTFG